MPHLSITGASGFVGKHLLNAFSESQSLEIRALTRIKKADAQNVHKVSFIEGDLLKPETLDALLEPGGTVINLAYLASNSKRDNVIAMKNLAEACARMRIKRLIHCSTAVVTGRVAEEWVDESTPCNPVSEYERTKLEMENILLEKSLGLFEISILRPTAVFGHGGKNLLKLEKGLNADSVWLTYAKSCLFYRRSMNLVCVENVVAALKFLLEADSKVDREVFIISDDDSPINNYHDIETRLREKFGKRFLLNRLALPLFILKAVLYISGRSIVNPSVKYSDKKIASFGFVKPQSFAVGIDSFAKIVDRTKGRESHF